MRFAPTDQQQDLLDGLGRLLDRYAGPQRARELGGDAPRYDTDLETRFIAAGFADVAGDPGAGQLEAELVTEAAARAGGVAALGAISLVVPGLGLSSVGTPVAIAASPVVGPVRFAADARTLLLLRGDEAIVCDLSGDDTVAVDSRYGYPMARLRQEPVGVSLGPASGSLLAAWWRVAVTAELVGTMDAAFSIALDHVRTRQQFGRSIGSFQAVQHRLAETTVLIEGSRWLVREAAHLGAPSQPAATAACYAISAAQRVFMEVHQLSGAIGFATEHDLHIFSMRLPTLVQEARSISPDAAAITALRWAGPPD